MRRPVHTYTKISQSHGASAPGTHFGKHLGCDYAGEEGRDVLAPVSGTIVQSYLSTVAGNTYELKEDGNGRLHRLMHLKTRPLGTGTHVNEGQVIASSGGAKGAAHSGTSSTGPHVHWDVRKAGTAWNASFDNYYNPEALLTPAPAPQPPAGVPDTSKVTAFRVKPGQTFRVYEPGTTNVRGTIDHSYGWYEKRGYDPKYPNRWLIHSAKYGKPTAFPYANTAGVSYLNDIETK